MSYRVVRLHCMPGDDVMETAKRMHVIARTERSIVETDFNGISLTVYPSFGSPERTVQEYYDSSDWRYREAEAQREAVTANGGVS